MRHINKGFTLIELIITLAVAAIVLGITMPSFQAQIRNNQSVALGEDFASAINFVRSEAVKRAARVSICASQDGATCSGSWTDGFIAFVDTATTDKAAAPVIGTVLRAWEKADLNAVITVQSNGGNVSFIRYTSLGTVAQVVNNPYVISAQLKDCKGSSARTINIGLSGLVSVVKATCTAVTGP